MTYTARCEHGELWAVCRECSTFDPRYVDEEPWAPELREQRRRSGYLAAVAFLAIVAIALIAWRTS